MASYSYLLKFIIVGDSKVGKSNILTQLIDHRFNSNYDITIGVEFGSYTTSVSGKSLKIQIWDTVNYI